ncbi:hypothetical protein J5N97_025991 [Dioscorea zingiberensis]|uniref:FCP1 homology domain-containing protein n=1 Tax=Dioscorea zingiberensis TaxID=325984 RepID=A0A9D5C264_9LILI|nr:hypothetical protein J5N97_025991 [Dioscorea zingiberensis]
MVSKISNRRTKIPKKASPKHHQRRRKKSPLKSLAAAPSALASSIDRSLRSCRRHLLKLFTRLAVLGTPTKLPRKTGGYCRLKPLSDEALHHPPSPYNPLPENTHNNKKKTIFLDLDETLVHSQTDPPPGKYDFTVHPMIDGRIMTFYVLKRPGVDEFLKAISKSFEAVVFTAGLKEYASLVLNQLDPTGELISHRLYRDSCREMDGKLVKDLAGVGRALDQVVIIDDNPNAYSLQPENAVPVSPFVDDLGDRELWRVMEFLEVDLLRCEDERDAVACYRTGNAMEVKSS